jgi:hypothetical protein
VLFVSGPFVRVQIFASTKSQKPRHETYTIEQLTPYNTSRAGR